MSSVQPLVDAAGRRRSAATMPACHAGQAPRNKGQRYPTDPPTVDEIVAVMRVAARARFGARLNGLIVVLWRAGLRIHEALSLLESDLDQRRGSVLVRPLGVSVTGIDEVRSTAAARWQRNRGGAFPILGDGSDGGS